jgi:predicted ester cyclase
LQAARQNVLHLGYRACSIKGFDGQLSCEMLLFPRVEDPDMTQQEIRDFMQNWYEQVWNKQDLSAIDRYVTSDVKAHGFDGENALSAEGFKAAVKEFHSLFPDTHIDVEDILVDGHKACVRWVATMTHAGPANNAGEKVRIPGISFVEFEGNLLAKGWDAYDHTKVNEMIATRSAQLSSPPICG